MTDLTPSFSNGFSDAFQTMASGDLFTGYAVFATAAAIATVGWHAIKHKEFSPKALAVGALAGLCFFEAVRSLDIGLYAFGEWGVGQPLAPYWTGHATYDGLAATAIGTGAYAVHKMK